jgi:hypothetical protein
MRDRLIVSYYEGHEAITDPERFFGIQDPHIWRFTLD